MAKFNIIALMHTNTYMYMIITTAHATVIFIGVIDVGYIEKKGVPAEGTVQICG